MLFGPAVGVALATLLANGASARAGEIEVCAEAEETAQDLAVLEEFPSNELDDMRGDCAPAELLPDASCEDAPTTLWPAAVR